MRLPSGTLATINSLFLTDRRFTLIGCLSPEERCCAVPRILFDSRCDGVKLLEIHDPEDAFPDYSAEAKERIDRNKNWLIKFGIRFESSTFPLVASEDVLIKIVRELTIGVGETVVLDITSLPKRYFCFLIKRLIRHAAIQNLIITATQAGPEGYTSGHLAEDPMGCEPFPGFAPRLPPEECTLVISVGFELLNIRSLLEVYNDPKRGTKLMLPFPPDGEAVRRTWSTVRQICSEPSEIRGNLEIVAGWDAELAFKMLRKWKADSDGLALAPFGAKAHSLAMVLFAIKYDCGLFYTQPKSYHPDYCKGKGGSMAYVVKWQGVACYDRTIDP